MSARTPRSRRWPGSSSSSRACASCATASWGRSGEGRAVVLVDQVLESSRDREETRDTLRCSRAGLLRLRLALARHRDEVGKSEQARFARERMKLAEDALHAAVGVRGRAHLL